MLGDEEHGLLLAPEEDVGGGSNEGARASEAPDPFEPPAPPGDAETVDAARKRLFSSLDADPRDIATWGAHGDASTSGGHESSWEDGGGGRRGGSDWAGELSPHANLPNAFNSQEAVLVTIGERKVLLDPTDEHASLYGLLRQWMDDDVGGQPWRLMPPRGAPGTQSGLPKPAPPGPEEEEGGGGGEEEDASASGPGGGSRRLAERRGAAGATGGADALTELKVRLKAAKQGHGREFRRRLLRYEARLNQLLPQLAQQAAAAAAAGEGGRGGEGGTGGGGGGEAMES